MSQTISVISGIGDLRAARGWGRVVLGGRILTPVSIGADPSQEDPHSASWAIRALQKSRDSIVKAWNDAWTLRAIAYNQALAAVAKRDKDFYAHAQAQWIEGARIQRAMADKMVENDTLRSSLYDQVQGKISLTQDAVAWFTQKGGLAVPNIYNAATGGTPIPTFPVYQ